MHARRTDANQREIVAALRAVGAQVHDTHMVGGGFPDLVVLFRGRVLLVETKVQGGRLNALQRAFAAVWPVEIWRTVDEALAAIGAVEVQA